MQKGTLKIRDVKKGKECKVVYENAKGKTVEMAIQPANRHFDLKTVMDGDPVEFELVNGIPGKCVVPGKESAPQAKPPRFQPANNPGNSGGQPGYRAGYGGGYGAGHMGGARGKALCNAVAPYNFVPFEAQAVLPAFEDEEGVWSGKIVCSLEALTPLLVSGGQSKATDKAPAQCQFMRANGQNIIPGTSIKEMLRSLMEILTFSNMRPVSQKHLFWRRVDRPDYRALFALGPTPEGQVLGGYLRKSGAEYELTPTMITPQKPEDPPLNNCERVKTGGFVNVKTGEKSKDYYFHRVAPNARSIRLNREVADRFRAQLTPNQEKRWSAGLRKSRMAERPGLPVFYRLDDNGEVADLGFCRFFRLAYKYSPHDLAYPDGLGVERDFVQKLFGTVGENTLKGRVIPFYLLRRAVTLFPVAR